MKKISLLLAFLLFAVLFYAMTPSHANAQLQRFWETIVGRPDLGNLSGGTEDPGGGSQQGDITFFCQYGAVNEKGVNIDPGRWNYGYSGGTCDIVKYGCAPTSLSMAMRYYGANINPTKSSKNTRNVACASGTNSGEIESAWRPFIEGEGYRFTENLTPWQATGNRVPLKTMKEFIDKGFLIIGGGAVNYASGGRLSDHGGHAFLVTDVNPSRNSITIYDPTFCSGSLTGGKRNISNAVDLGGWLGCDARQGVCGWLYAYAIKKK